MRICHIVIFRMNMGKTRPLHTDMRRWIAVHAVVGVTVSSPTWWPASGAAWAWWRREPAVGFWYALRFAQVAVVVQVMLGAVLLLLGKAAADLHYLYGVLPIVVSLAAEAIRSGAAERELEGLDFDSLPRAPPGRDRDGDRPP